MPLIKVSDKVKKELEELKAEGEFKSLDAVIRHYISSFVEVNGGIFLGSDGGVWNNIINVRRALIRNNYSNYHITPPETIRLYKCLTCGTTCSQKEDELIIVPNCAGCGNGMTPIIIQIGDEFLGA